MQQRKKYAALISSVVILLIVSMIVMTQNRESWIKQEEDLERGSDSVRSVSEAVTYVPVLMYHKLDDAGIPGRTVITSDRFREHLQALSEEGYETIFETELLDYLNGAGTLPEKPVLITFDDGYLDNYIYAFPALKEYDMKATIYIIVSYRGETPGWNEHFDWHHAQEMVSTGHISIQSHSYDSHHLIPNTQTAYLVGKRMDEEGRIETDEEYEERVKQDLAFSKQLIEEKTGQPVVSFSYPYGQFSAQTEKWLQEFGYGMSLSVRNGLYKAGDSPWALPRITVNGEWSGKKLVMEIDKLKN